MVKKRIDLVTIFRDFLKKEALEGKKILLLVSGGVDSMVLLDIAEKVVNKKNLAVFHLDHQWRKNSHKDFELVQKICSDKNIKFFGEKWKTIFQKEAKKINENDARKRRKNCAEKVAKIFGAKKILTAHHATDLVETMIFRLTKGSGFDGLSPFQTDSKPFWEVPKSDLISHATAEKILWHEDETNADTDIPRNAIRHSVLPVLRNITPNLESVFVKESEMCSDVANFFSRLVTEKAKNPLLLKVFRSWDPALKRYFLYHLAGKNISFDEIEDALKWLEKTDRGGSQKKIGGKTLILKKGEITGL